MQMHYITLAIVGRKRHHAEDREILEMPATITERGQTTVPAAIRKMLALGKRDRVVFRGLADGTVVLAKKTAAEKPDPVIGKFLALLAKDIASSPCACEPCLAIW